MFFRQFSLDNTLSFASTVEPPIPITLPLVHVRRIIMGVALSTVEPLNNGHIGGRTLVLFREVVPIVEVAS